MKNTLTKGKLYIIPVPISEDTFHKVMPAYNAEVIKPIRIFVVEKLKTARQFLRKTDSSFPIDDCTFFELDKHDDYNFDTSVIQFLNDGKDVGLMSESSYAGVADPGLKIISLAHKNNIQVIPLIGPSSIITALAASGMNGQGFTFHGYLPKSGHERIQKIKDLVTSIQKTGYAQLFIETPYRNQNLFEDLLKSVPDEIRLSVAYDITGALEFIKTKSISEWKKNPFEFDKMPCVFVMG
ncbi:MAG: SAM-dependent methyltransferase [Crocinitomicaceae bacterium]|nr:SAM-dependent methyltransferase [Crocinitomicaceae bacterium]